VSEVLSSLHHIRSYSERGLLGNDYERIVKETFEKTKISHHVLSNFGVAMHDFKVRTSGAILGTMSCKTNDLADFSLCPKLIDAEECFVDTEL
jgi:hypothetical protein